MSIRSLPQRILIRSAVPLGAAVCAIALTTAANAQSKPITIPVFDAPVRPPIAPSILSLREHDDVVGAVRTHPPHAALQIETRRERGRSS